jgi:hypothetical protein
MNSQDIEQIESAIKSEITIDDQGRGTVTIRGAARLLGVSDTALHSQLKGANLDGSKMVTMLACVGFGGANLDEFSESGIPDTALAVIGNYYAMMAGRYCTEKARMFAMVMGAVGVRAWMQKVAGWESVTPVDAVSQVQAEMAIAKLHINEAYLPFQTQHPAADIIFRELISVPSISHQSAPQPISQPTNVPSAQPSIDTSKWEKLIDTLGLAANRAGLAGNKATKEGEFLDKRLDKLRTAFMELEEENIRLKAKNKTLQNELRDEVEQLISDCDQELEKIKVNAAKEVEAGLKKAEKTFRKAYFDHLDIEVTKLREGVQKLTKRNPDRDDAIDIKFWSR